MLGGITYHVDTQSGIGDGHLRILPLASTFLYVTHFQYETREIEVVELMVRQKKFPLSLLPWRDGGISKIQKGKLDSVNSDRWGLERNRIL